MATAVLDSTDDGGEHRLHQHVRQLAGYLGNHLFGWLRSRGMTDSTGLLFLAGCYFVGGAIVSRVRVYHQKSPL
jgi:hypothetical protein